jgi:N-acyl-D-amino-acid deacylase
MDVTKIESGTVVDGTGSPAQTQDVVIEGDQITYVGKDYDGTADTVIDGTHLVVAPGFIDVHSHADFTILDRPLAEYKILQGFTTEVVGNCALGLAPVNDAMEDYYKHFLNQFFQGATFKTYDSFAEELDAVSQNPVAVNLAYLVPHGIVRLFVMNIDPRDPTPDEVDKMTSIIEDAMANGAFGMSTGLVYPAGSFSKTPELVAMARPVARYGGVFTSHIRNEGSGVAGAIQEILQVARETGVRVEISHMKSGGPGATKNLLKCIDLINRARAQGIQATADFYPYEYGATELGLVVVPTWALKDMAGYFARPECRERIINETIQRFVQVGGLPPFLGKLPRSLLIWAIFKYISNRVLIINAKNTPEVNGKFFGEAFQILYPGKSPLNQIFQFILDNEGSVSVAMKFFNEAKSMPPLLRQDWTCIGTDGFTPVTGNIHPRASGTMGKILGRYVRDLGVLSLEDAIRKATSFPARVFHLDDRGVIAPNLKADLVVFDPKIIADVATFADASKSPPGIHHVFVNGVQVVKDGQVTGATPGELLRHRPQID